MDDALIDKLELPMMVRDNRASLGTAFTVSIEARQGDTVAHARAMLKRSTVAGQWPSVVWQTIE